MGMTAGQRPERRYAPAAELTVLHLSDPQFGGHHMFGGNGLPAGATAADRDRDSLFARLHEDLAKLARAHELWPDLLVVTGDLAERGLPSEFDQVVEFLERLAGAVELPRRRVAIVPGNHDVNRMACQQYFLGEAADERKPVPPFWPKWRHFAAAFDRFYAAEQWPAGSGRPEFTLEQPWSLFEMADLRVVVAGLNSTMAESHRDGDHYGWVGEGQLAWFAERLRRYRDDGWLVLAAVHHNAVRGAVDDEENLRDADDLDRALGPGAPGGAHLLLHGHTHDGRLHRLSSGLLAYSTGSAAVTASARPAEVPNQYQLLTLRADGVTRHTRAYLFDRKTWTGDNRADVATDSWHHTEPVALDAPAALAGRVAAGGSRRPSRPDHLPLAAADGPGPVDPFLDEVAEVTRLRFDGATVRLHPSPVAGRSYLRVTRRDEFGSVDQWPVGAVADPVTRPVLDTFVAEVHVPSRALDPLVRSHLVYGGPPPDQAVLTTARSAGVALHSLVEYRGLIDLGRVRERQREQVERDTRYPAALYVPQRFRREHPVLLWDADGRPTAEDGLLELVATWLGQDGARFITVLGDFGRGKTFLMRQLVRELPRLVGGLEPLLLELHGLDKGPDLYDLVGQQLRRLDAAGVTDAKVRHLVSRGRVALLLDGFDELVQRVSYPTAAAYLETLLGAATGEAKIVLTSRGQHFRDDSQVRDALLSTPTGRDASRILALEDFTEGQILEFLRRLYGGDSARAESRFGRLGEVRDLLGLSGNPRMLAFIAALPDARLDEAQRTGDGIGAAELYREILDHWLAGEVTRHTYRFGRQVLPRGERLAACRALALRLWTASAGDTVSVEELTATTAQVLTELETLGFTGEQAAHTIGSGSLLTRGTHGFGFVHRSVMEWLVADTAATELRAGAEPAVLAARDMSDLMTDFFCDLAGHDAAMRWAYAVNHRASDEVTRAQGANATRVLTRLLRRADTPTESEPPSRGSTWPSAYLEIETSTAAAPHRQQPPAQPYAEPPYAEPYEAGYGPQPYGAQPASAGSAAPPAAPAPPGPRAVPPPRGEPLDLTGQDLRDQDVAALGLPAGGGPGLRGAVLRDTVWTGMRLAGLDLSGADLTGADLRGTRLDGVDLAGARLVRARLEDARLTGTGLAGADLTGADLAGARLRDVDLTDSVLTGSRWSGAGLLGADLAGVADAAELAAAAVVGRDPARPSLAASQSRRASPSSPADEAGGGVSAVAAMPLPDGRTLLVTATAGGTLRLWDPTTGAAVGTPISLPPRSGVSSVAAVPAPDGRMLLAAAGEAGLMLSDPTTGAPVSRLGTGYRRVFSVTAVPLPDGRVLLAAGGDRTLELWDVGTGGPVGDPLIGHRGAVLSVAGVRLPDGRMLLASAGDDGKVVLREAATGLVRTRSAHHRDVVYAVTAVPVPDGRVLLASAGGDGTVWLLDPAAGEPVGPPMVGHAGAVLSLAAVPLPDGSALLASGGADGTVSLWDPTTGAAAGYPLAGHSGRVLSLTAARLPDGRALLASGSDDGTVRLWRLSVHGRAPADGRRAVPEPDVRPVATSVASGRGGWATLLPDERSYKSGGGDVSDVLWWTVKQHRFEAGELDPYDPGVRRLPDQQPIL